MSAARRISDRVAEWENKSKAAAAQSPSRITISPQTKAALKLQAVYRMRVQRRLFKAMRKFHSPFISCLYTQQSKPITIALKLWKKLQAQNALTFANFNL
jgi:hypothetical protein